MTSVYVSVAVEGIIDEAVAQRLVLDCGGSVSTIYGKTGNARLHSKVKAYNRAAVRFPWLVLIDLDTAESCAPSLRTKLLPTTAEFMCFRIAVREVEAWLLADREELSNYLSVPLEQVPLNPEAQADPKKVMIELAKASADRSIRKGMVPDPKSERHTGREYDSILADFARGPWRPHVAASNADSLRRSLKCLRRMLSNYKGPD